MQEALFGSAPFSATSARLVPENASGAFHVIWAEPLNANGITAVPEWSPDGLTWLTSGQSAPGIPARRINTALTGTTATTCFHTASLEAGVPRALLLRCRVIP